MRYRQKPPSVEAKQWDGSPVSANRVIDWILSNGGTARYHDEVNDQHIAVDVTTGTLHVSPTDWIIKTPEGSFESCDTKTFRGTYEVDS